MSENIYSVRYSIIIKERRYSLYNSYLKYIQNLYAICPIRNIHTIIIKIYI